MQHILLANPRTLYHADLRSCMQEQRILSFNAIMTINRLQQVYAAESQLVNMKRQISSLKVLARTYIAYHVIGYSIYPYHSMKGT